MLSKLRGVVPESWKQSLRQRRAMLLSVGLSRDASFAQPENEQEASAHISIIIAIKDAPEMLTRCLASVEKYAPRAEVVLVNDGSVLAETRSIIEAFSARNSWKTVHHGNPKGHSSSCEAGAELATRAHLCLLNSDTVVTPWSWFAAKDAFESDERIGITGPSTSYTATPQTLNRAVHCRYYWNDSQIFSFAQKHLERLPPRSWVDLPQVGGFGFFIRTALWNKFGGFDSKLRDYGNETELCRRAIENGLRVVWTQNSYIHHFGHQSYSKTLPLNEINRRGANALKYINEKYQRQRTHTKLQ